MRIRTVAAACAALSVIVATVVATAVPGSASTMTQKRFVRQVERSRFERMLSGQARAGIRLILGIKRDGGEAPAGSARASTAPRRLAAAPTNVLVNDPSTDGVGQPDMTTQNEVSLAVSGSSMVAAYNDDGTSPEPGGNWISPATNISGYSWSDDGGATWQDSQMPNNEPRMNFGDPVVVADGAGHFFYADLSLQFSLGRIDIAVGRSDDGGQTFSEPKTLPEGTASRFVLSDKPWMTVGPDPGNPSAEVLYVGWQQSYFDAQTSSVGTRIVVSASRDLGATWTAPVTVFDQPFATRTGIGFVNGTSMAVDPATGRLYVAWEQLINRAGDQGRFALRRELVAHSDDGGASYQDLRRAARVSGVGTVIGACGNVLSFGTGRLVRITDFPSLGVGPGGRVLVAFNSNDANGVPAVKVATSTDGGHAWSVASVAGPPESFMPNLSADATGASVVYYQRATSRTLRTGLATSPDGSTWTTQDLSDTTFPVPLTVPNPDPFPAYCYMGDYVAAVRTGGVTYGAWGDNRDIVTNEFWPDGRPDPDVYFAQS